MCHMQPHERMKTLGVFSDGSSVRQLVARSMRRVDMEMVQFKWDTWMHVGDGEREEWETCVVGCIGGC